MKARGRIRADQAALALGALVGLGACAERTNWPDPVGFWREASGRNLAARLPPPGLDGASPNLGQVPARPDRPSSAQLAAINRALVEDRERAAAPRGFGAGALPALPDSPGRPPVPGAPPPPPALAAAPAIPWGAALPARPVEPPGGPRAGEELRPGAVPDLPPPELLAPAPPPLPGLLRR